MDLLAKLYWQEQFGALVVNLPLEHEFGLSIFMAKRSHLTWMDRSGIMLMAQCKRWERKGRLSPETFTTIHRDACEQTMLEVSEGRWHWIAKHVSGHAGVGVKLLQWQQRDDDRCPWCGDPEDTCHVWTCLHPDACWLQST